MTFKQSPAGFRNVRGQIIKNVQAQLNNNGFAAGVVDGVFGSNTINALDAWQQSKGLPASAVIDDATWTGLMQGPVPVIFQRALQLTADWEGTGFGLANGDFDGQGITWGIVGFTWKYGELQGILQEILASYPVIFHNSFGDLETQMLNILQQPLSAQMQWAGSISIGNGQRIQPDWEAAFVALGSAPEVQQIELQHTQSYWQRALSDAAKFNIQSEPGLALCFDIAVQNGGISSSEVASIQNQLGAGPASENTVMGIIANTVAENSNPQWRSVVLARKMTFVNQQGAVNGDQYDISCWGIG